MTSDTQASAGRPTRRSLVQGFGVLAGASVLAVPVLTATSASAVPQPGEPSTQEASAVTAGLTYVAMPQYAFIGVGMFATYTGIGAYIPGSAYNLIAPLTLPTGSVIRELTVGGSNDSGNPSTLRIGRTALAGGALGDVATVSLPSAALEGVRSATAGANHAVSAEHSYQLLASTTAAGTATIFSARVGYLPPPTPGVFKPLAAPVRIYDSRPGALPLGGVKGKFTDHEERVLDAKLGTGVPASASSVLVNVTATNTNPGGFFSLFRDGIAWPGTSTLNWGTQNATVSSLGATQVTSGLLKARCEGPGGADLIVDVVGYFT
jgi:hypothetical protein